MKKIHLLILAFGILNGSLDARTDLAPLEVQSGPGLATVSPAIVHQGDTVNFTVTAHNTHFKEGMTGVKIYSAKSVYYVYPIATTIVNDTTIIAKYYMYYQHQPALFSLCVENPGEGEWCLDTCINLLAGSSPPSYSITPTIAVQGQSINFTIKGTNTHFLKYNVGAYGVSLYNPTKFYAHVTSTNVVYVNDTLITGTFNFNYRDSTGIYDVQVNGFAPDPPIVLSKGFTLTAGPNQPMLKTISPSVANQGDAKTIHIVSKNTHFLSGITKVAIGSYDAKNVHVINDSTLDVDFLFTYNMFPAVYTIIVENTVDGRLPLTNAFTLKTGLYPPSLKYISPSYAKRGQTLTIHVIGKNTNFQYLTSKLEFSNNFGPSIKPTAIDYINDTLLDATFSFSDKDSLGYYNVIVYSSVEPTVLLRNAFILYSAGASIVSLSPNTSSIGSTIQITAHCIGSHYLSNLSTMQLKSIYGGDPLPGSNITAVNDSTLTGTFSFTNSNFNGNYKMIVNNAVDGTLKIDSAFMLNPAVGEPRITSVYPHMVGFDSFVTITLRANGTHFKQGIDSVRLSNWLNNIYPISIDVKNDTTIVAVFKTPPYSSKMQNLSTLDIVVWGNQPLVYLRGVTLILPVTIKKVDQQRSISIYPNPSEGIFNIFLDDESALKELQILDLTGRIIYRQNKLNKIIDVDISSYPAGMYYLVLLGVNSKEVVKIIKQ
jgi:hypothetical protein